MSNPERSAQRGEEHDGYLMQPISETAAGARTSVVSSISDRSSVHHRSSEDGLEDEAEHRISRDSYLVAEARSFIPSRASSVTVKGPDEVGDEHHTPPTTRLQGSRFLLLVVLVYVGLAIFAWTITCLLTYRPISTTIHTYTTGGVTRKTDYRYFSDAKYILKVFLSVDRWLRAARIIRAILSTATIPLTSAVCSHAAIVFLQKHASVDISMRKVLTMADQKWAKPSSWFAIIGSWHRYGTSFLAIAILLNVLGALTIPLQEGLLSTKTIKTPLTPQIVASVVDFANR